MYRNIKSDMLFIFLQTQSSNGFVRTLVHVAMRFENIPSVFPLFLDFRWNRIERSLGATFKRPLDFIPSSVRTTNRNAVYTF